MSTLVHHRAPSFYVVGGTLLRDAPSYVEREADQRLYIALRQQEICYVLTPRQMGKSSLMVRTAARLRESGVAVVVLDLTGLGQNLTTEQWYNGLLDKVGQQLHLEEKIDDAWLQWIHLGPLQRWMRTLREVVLPNCRGGVAIFIDEIDTVRSLPFSTDEFFAGIRELYNRRTEEPDLHRLTFCLMGVATPSDLIRDTRTTPFNIGRRIELTDFTEEEAAPLARGLGREHGTGQELLKRVLYWTGGHPYLTQRLCQAIAEDNQVESPKGVDQICGDLFLSRRARERDDNLVFVRELILRSEVETAGLLTLYAKIRANKRVRDEETDPLIAVLRLSGITRVERGFIKIRNRVYRQVFDEAWVTSNLPGAELRRQRAAYVRGLKRAAATILTAGALGVGIAWWYFYKTATQLSIGELELKLPAPPAFWLSGSIQASPQVGALLVKTGDEYVTVFIAASSTAASDNSHNNRTNNNEQQYGLTSKRGELRIPGLPPGLYKIRVEKPGFQAITQEAKIIENSETQLAFKLQRQVVAGQIALKNALPGTEVSLDAKYVGSVAENGSFFMTATPGEHKIELTKDGYVSKQITQQLSLGTLLEVNGELVPDPESQEWKALADRRDPEALEPIQAFLRKYPRGKFFEKARGRAEQLAWQSLKDRDDSEVLNLLEAYLQRYPKGQFENEARERVKQLQTEQMAWLDASKSKNPADLEAFVAKYPQGPYTQQAREIATRGDDQQAILNLLKQYEEAYDRQDIDTLSKLWPTMPANFKRATQAKFQEAQSVSLTLRVDNDQPEIIGNNATVKGKQLLKCIKKDRSKSDDEYPFTFQMAKQKGQWIISNGR